MLCNEGLIASDIKMGMAHSKKMSVTFSNAVSVIFRESGSLLAQRRRGRGQRRLPLITRAWRRLSSLSGRFRPRLLRLLRRHRRSLRGLRRLGWSARAVMARMEGEIDRVRRRIAWGWAGRGRGDDQFADRDHGYPAGGQEEAASEVPYGDALRHTRGPSAYGQQQGEIIFDNELFGFRTRVRLVENEVRGKKEIYMLTSLFSASP